MNNRKPNVFAGLSGDVSDPIYGPVGKFGYERWYVKLTSNSGNLYKVHDPSEAEIDGTIGYIINFVDETGRYVYIGGSSILTLEKRENRIIRNTTVKGYLINPQNDNKLAEHTWSNTDFACLSTAVWFVVDEWEKHLEREFDKALEAGKKLLQGLHYD